MKELLASEVPDWHSVRRLKPDVVLGFRHTETIRHARMYSKMHLHQAQEDFRASNRAVVECLTGLKGVLALSLVFSGLQLAAMLEA